MPACSQHDEKEIGILLVTAQVEDFGRFIEVFSPKGADKRRQHGSKNVLVFRDPSGEDRV